MGLIVSLDSNIFILALDHPGTKGDKARELLLNIKLKAQPVYLSVLVIEEFFVKVYKMRREKETEKILNFITMGGWATLVDLDQEIALLAAKLRAQYNCKAPDAIHLATAIHAGAKIFISTDKRLPKKIGKLRIEVLS